MEYYFFPLLPQGEVKVPGGKLPRGMGGKVGGPHNTNPIPRG